MNESKLRHLLHCATDEIQDELPILLHVDKSFPPIEQKEKGIHEQGRLSGLHLLHVNDGICSYDQVYLHEDLNENINLLRNVLLKVEEVETLESILSDDGKEQDDRHEEKISLALLVTKAEVLVHPIKFRLKRGEYADNTFDSCFDMMFRDYFDDSRCLPDMSKYLLWRIEDPTKSYSDFRIIVKSQNEDEGIEENYISRRGMMEEIYHVHKAVLAFGTFADSKYFTHLFRDGGQLAEGKKNELILQLSRAQARVFPVLLNYLYSGKLLPVDYEYRKMNPKDEDETCNYKRSDVKMLVDDHCQSLVMLADYFQIPSLLNFVKYRIEDNMQSSDELPLYLPCLIASQHINEMKRFYIRAVFILVQQFLGVPSWSASEILASIDVEFLVDVLQLCHRLTHVHNRLLAEHTFNESGEKVYKGSSGYKRCLYITSIIVSKYLTVHDNCVSPENLLNLTNEDHMPQVSPDVAQHFLDIVEATIKSSCVDINFRSLRNRCLDALEGSNENMMDEDIIDVQQLCIRVLTVDSANDFACGTYKICMQEIETGNFSSKDCYYTNSRGPMDQYQVSNEDAVKDFHLKIFHLFRDNHIRHRKWYLCKRNDEGIVGTIIKSLLPCNPKEFRTIYGDFHPMFPPPIGWTFKTEPFFLEYVLEDDIDDDLPLAA